MTKTEMQQIAKELTEKLRTMPNGTEISTAELLCLCGYDTKNMSFTETMDIHTELMRIAPKAGITLDMSAHKGKVEGSPVNLTFIARNLTAQIKCPRCGSRSKARILYGMPVFNEKLENDIRSGKIHLGGCKITEVTDAAGNSILLDPVWYCNVCKKEFARPAYLPTEDYTAAEAYANIVTGICFTWSKRFPQRTELCVQKNDDGAAAFTKHFPGNGNTVQERQITKRQWSKLIGRLFGELYLHDWKREYTDPNVLDGEQWSLEIKMTEDRCSIWSGSNLLPPYWRELRLLLAPYLREDHK